MLASAASTRLRIVDADLFIAPPLGVGEPLLLVHGAWTGQTTWGC